MQYYYYFKPMAMGYRFGLALKILWPKLPFVFFCSDLYLLTFLISLLLFPLVSVLANVHAYSTVLR